MSDYTSFRLFNGRMASSVNQTLPEVPLNAGAGNVCRDPDAGTCGLIGLTVKESIFSPTVMGEGYIRDYDGSFISSLGSYIGIGGYDLLLLDFQQEGDGIPSVTKTLQFMVYAYSQVSNEVESLSKSESVPRIIVLKLASPEFALLNYLFFEYFETDEDMILPISREPDDEEQTGQCEQYQGEGLVQYLVGKMNDLAKYPDLSPLNAEPTKNWIWLKRNYSMYPWGKMVSPPRIMQLMQMLADNAVHKDNEFAANFFFWRGLDAWNFYSLETLVDRAPVKTYRLSPNVSCMNHVGVLVSDGVDEFLISSHDETDYFDLMKSHAFGSNYLSVNPNYSNPYYRYLDAAGGHTIKIVEYDYFTQGGLWKKLPNDEFSDYIGAVVSCGDGLITRNAKNNRVVDNNYGYFSPGFFNNDKHVRWEYYGYTFASRQEKNLWQTQFDITPIEGEDLYNVMKKVKQPLQKARERYAELKNLKEAWKVYKCSVCCAGDIDSNLGMGVTGVTFSGGITLNSTFINPKAAKSFNLRNTATSELSGYEIVSAGSFTDVINFDARKIGVGYTGVSLDGEGNPAIGQDGNPVIKTFQNEWTLSGMSLSYNLNESPYNLTLGEFLSLEKEPDNFVKYRFDLEIHRHEKLKQILLNNIQARDIRNKNYQTEVDRYKVAYDQRTQECSLSGYTGYCSCPTEYPETVKIKAGLVTGGHESLASHEEKVLQEIDQNIQNLTHLKEEFIELYDKYWSRKAFFFSRNIDFSFLKSGNNLFNVKSITRKPIVGSKYEPFAYRRSLNGNFFLPNQDFLGATGATVYYPYYVAPMAYNIGDRPSILDVGRTFTNVYYGRKYNSANQADNWSSFDFEYSSFPYSEANNEKAKGPIWYKNWLVSYNVSVIRPPCLNRKPLGQEEDCWCEEIKIPLKMHFETFASNPQEDILTKPNQTYNYAFTQLSKNCDGCKIQITAVDPASDVKLYHPWGADGLSGNQPFTVFDYEDYKRASSLLVEKPGITGFYNNAEYHDNKYTPPHILLEGLESYVRIEFKTPIGLETLQNFPEGFIDTYGSEYFLPYIVLLTAGPFGAPAAAANISVIGQDPYGFDVAVKKTKNRNDFAKMDLMYAFDEEGHEFNDDFLAYPNLEKPFSTSSSWMKTSQNSLFYKPKDSVADLFVPNGIQDIFMASAMERSLPAKTWWDLWVSLPPIAVATFYNRWDVYGASGSSLKTLVDTGAIENPGFTYQGIAFFSNNSIVAEPISWTGDTGCSGGCEQNRPWPLFLHPDTEQMISGAFPSNSAATIASEMIEISGPLGEFDNTLYPGPTSSILPSDPSNYVYGFAEFPHVVGISGGLTAIDPSKLYPVVSYPVGTLIWGQKFAGETFDIYYDEGIPRLYKSETGRIKDHNLVCMFDISRKTQYGLVQLSSDSMPSLLSMIKGLGGDVEEIQEYNRWVSDKLIDWFQNSIFDNNFSAQFVVMSKGKQAGCEGYPCMNPDGFPGLSGCTSGDPLCNCPCIDLRPDLLAQGATLISGLSGNRGKEPSSLELEYLEKVTSECNRIESEPCLGRDWLGCVWDDPYSPLNCNCPCIGKKFPTYLGINRTNATFWGTPLETPLLRTAQMALFNSNKIEIQVYGDITVKSGDVVFLDAASEAPEGYSRFHGYWLASSVNHEFSPFTHKMKLTLSRELPYPCELSPGQPPPTTTP